MYPVLRTQNNWLPEIFNDFFGNEWSNKPHASAPAMNIMETDQAFKVEIAAPGLTKEDVRIKLGEDDQLVVCYEKKDEKKDEKKGKYLRRDFSYTSFQQSLILPENADLDKISAAVENGILTVSIPKLTPVEQAKKERLIDIQ